MRYVIINKLTNNLVEKIIFPEGGFEPVPEMLPSYLELIVDNNDVVTNCHMKYDESSQSFVTISDDDRDNPKIARELLDIKTAIAEMSEEKDSEIIKLKLALVELAEGMI
jgi:hypothetical protein